MLKYGLYYKHSRINTNLYIPELLLFDLKFKI